jgi:hypothetical protein
MALYDTRFGLPQGVADYLNQGLPSISGIFPPVAGINPIKPSPDDSVVGLPYYKDEPMPQPSGGDGFSPYDIRPGDSSIRTPDQYSPYAYNQAMRNTEKFGQTVGPNPDLYYAPLTGIEQLMSKIPTPLGFVKKGLDALADKLPVNRTAIFQNELLGQGIKLDNIGRIVTDNYRTPEGIMAGYNPVSGGLLNMLTGGAYGEPTQYGLENAVAERQENIKNTLQDKYGLSNEQIEDVLSEIGETGTYTGPFGFNQTMGKTTNLFTDLFNLGVFNQKQLDAKKKADIIFEQKLKEKRESDPAFIEQQKIKKAAETRRDFQQTVKDAEKKAADEFAGKGSGASGPAGGAAKKAADKRQQIKKLQKTKMLHVVEAAVVVDLILTILQVTMVVISVSIQALLFKWQMVQLKKLKIYNLVMTLKVEKLQVCSNLKRLTRFTITKVLLLQVVTTLKKMVNLLWLKTAYYPSRSIRYL